MTLRECLERLEHWPANMQARLLEPLQEGRYDWVHFPGMKACKDDIVDVITAIRAHLAEVSAVRDEMRDGCYDPRSFWWTDRLTKALGE